MKNRYVFLALLMMMASLALTIWLLPLLDERSSAVTSTYQKEVFNQKKVSTIDFQVDPSDLKEILDNPLKKEVIPATVIFNGKKIEQVGLRTKGNMTLRSVAQMQDSDRYSFKVDFDYYKDGQNLFGLKKLALNNGFSDSTQMKEFLSYELMETMGVPTPEHSYMYVTINGKEWGLYLGVEAIDETFLANNYDNYSGDLYKPDGVGSDLKWISNDISDYTGLDLKTNKKTSKQKAMIHFLDTINHGGHLEKVMDVDEMLRYFAANTALVNLDHYQGSMKHNYYLYENNGKFSILPWDYNMAFGGFSGGAQPANNQQSGQGMDNKQSKEPNNSQQGNGMAGGMGNMMSESNINFSISEPVSGTTIEDRPLLDALLTNKEYKKTYNGYLKEIANHFFKESNMKKRVAEISALILPYVVKDPTKFTTTDQFKEGVSGDNSIAAFSSKRAESILKQLSGELVVKAETNQNGMENGEGMNPPQQGMNMGGEPPGFSQGKMEGKPPENKEGEQPLSPPDGQAMGFPGGDREQDQEGPPNGDQKEGFSLGTWITLAVSLLVLLAGIIFALTFKRRRI
ncbi:CotH kinase family protein [Bacillus sp. 1P06AnD]|uniref:CotH kinase family protein n=1 Tax=Bacillus sp. 1P06AnD TaxID=3132208 RepID=UPI0039A00D6B